MKKLNKPTTILVAFAIAAAMTGCGNEPTKDLGGGIYEINGHKFVDLGLPSGTLWADRNIGADSPYDVGDYFAWGEVFTKTTYSKDNYKYGGSSKYTKYNSEDGKTILDAADDAATVNWGSRCRMPTFQECQELTHKCNWTWQSNYNGSAGYLVIGPNGKSIFFPTTGYYSVSYLDRDEEMKNGYYLLKDRPNNLDSWAHNLYFNPNSLNFAAGFILRYKGAPIRPAAERMDGDMEFDNSWNNNGSTGGNNSGGSGSSSSGGGSTSYEKPDIALEDYTTYPTKIKVNYRIYNQDKAKVTSAKVYYGTSSPSKSISTTVAGTLITTYISGLKKGTTYYVKCIATGKGGSTTSETTRIITDF